MKKNNRHLSSPRPNSEQELLARASALAGLTFASLASELALIIPEEPTRRKGWFGMAIELALGADSKSLSRPDFHHLGIELKTIPLSLSGKPAESTFITSIPMLTIHQQQWETSQCFDKLKRILWIPVEGDPGIPYTQRRIGKGFLWSPDERQAAILQKDWMLLTGMIITGQLESIDARLGEYLQIRPKGAHGKSLCYALDAEGNRAQTLPRGFYVRPCFTWEILGQVMG